MTQATMLDNPQNDPVSPIVSLDGRQAHERGWSHGDDTRRLVARIIAAYDNPVVRWYSRVRFVILRQRFLDEIGQYLPERGRVIDVGCGFGLFALYFAALHPRITIEGVDLSPRRIAMATGVAARLGIENVSFRTGNAEHLAFGARNVDCVYMLDIVHHIARTAVQPLLQAIAGALVPGGVLIVKDVDTRPFHKMAFTWLLDKLMDSRADVHYWPSDVLRSLLHDLGFSCHSHAMVDILPYPHVLYVARTHDVAEP